MSKSLNPKLFNILDRPVHENKGCLKICMNRFCLKMCNTKKNRRKNPPYMYF